MKSEGSLSSAGKHRRRFDAFSTLIFNVNFLLICRVICIFCFFFVIVIWFLLFFVIRFPTALLYYIL